MDGVGENGLLLHIGNPSEHTQYSLHFHVVVSARVGKVLHIGLVLDMCNILIILCCHVFWIVDIDFVKKVILFIIIIFNRFLIEDIFKILPELERE